MQLTIKQAADLMEVGESQIRRWIRDRGLPAVVFNEQYRLNRIDLLAWAQTQQINVPAQALSAVESGRVSLRQALTRGGIHREVPGSTGREVLQVMLQRIVLPAHVDRDLLLEVILARQAQGSTSVGHGIAIPHARYPMVAATDEPILALGFAKTPVELGGHGMGPVRALFLLLSPSIRAHLHLVARLARALSSDLLGPVEQRANDYAILTAATAGDEAADAAAPRSTP